MTNLSKLFFLAMLWLVTSCADHDDPKLAPIDTTQIKITASVTATPSDSWLNQTEEMTIRVENVDMLAPKGVVLKSINLVYNYTYMEKPYSGQPLEFKVPLTYINGRVNFSIIGNLIKKNSRDAEILIADNIQRIVFNQTPKLECKAHVNVTVKSVSTAGEEFSQWFDVESDDAGVIFIPQDKLYWVPTSGTASTIELTLGGGADTWSSNSTLESEMTKISWGSKYPEGAVLKITLPNTPGALDKENLELFIQAKYFGTTENVTIEPRYENIYYVLKEAEK